MSEQYCITFQHHTRADSPAEAIQLAREAIAGGRSPAAVELWDDGTKDYWELAHHTWQDGGNHDEGSVLGRQPS